MRVIYKRPQPSYAQQPVYVTGLSEYILLHAIPPHSYSRAWEILHTGIFPL